MGAGLATSRVVRLVVYVVGVEALGEIYKAWPDSFREKATWKTKAQMVG